MALLLGIVLAVAMFTWTTLRGTQNLFTDLSVGEGRPASEMERH